VGLEPLEPRVQLVEGIWMADSVNPGTEILDGRGLTPALQLVDLRVWPAEPLCELSTGEPAVGGREAQLPQPYAENLAGLLIVRAHRCRSALLVELCLELVVPDGRMDSGVPHLAVPQDLGGLCDDLHVVEHVLVVEAQHRHETAVEEPEVFCGRCTRSASSRQRFLTSSPVVALHRA